jgi:hypothetical protein
MSRIVKPMLDLKSFMLRQKVLRLYRSLLRHGKEDIHLRETITASFRAQQYTTDTVSIRALLAEGNRSLQQLQDRIAHGDDSDGRRNANNDSWINSSDGDDDIKGRIGTGWPWAK